MDDKLKNNISDESIWLRGVFIMIFGMIYYIAKIVVFAVVIMQFFVVLINGDKNQKLLHLGDGLSHFIFQILQYITFNSDDKPFPFSDWPSSTS